MTIARHRTAITRNFLSRPLQQAHEDGLLVQGISVFDYGCGHGDDIRTLGALGIEASGWDPAHHPDGELTQADIVNLGYVVNVIEYPDERVSALKRSWSLARSVLIVAARLIWDPDSSIGKPYLDGRVTCNGTFQKFYAPEELKAWIESSLGRRVVTAAPGIYYVFRDDIRAQKLLARSSRNLSRPRQGVAELLYEQSESVLRPLEEYVREHRRLPNPTDLADGAEVIESFGSIRAAFSVVRRATGAENWIDVDLGSRRRSEQRFEDHLEDLQPLIDFVSERGRLPRRGELDNEATLNDQFGSVRAAFSLVRRVTGPSKWSEFETEAKENFLVYVALAAFGGRPLFKQLPGDLQYDAKDLFGSYKAACEAADDLLYSIADVPSLDSACIEAPFGKLTPEALYVHASATSQLPPLLRVYIGAAETLTGNVDDATIVKLHRQKPQVSFLIYPSFDKEPHPPLHGSLVARLPELRITYKNFSNSENPPILHRKETFVPPDYPARGKFERLTRQEERAGVLDADHIGRQREWEHVLEARGYRLQGHRLVSKG
ncbi:MAG: DNA phosphorothioation-associated putative methyltransferase [Actinomycetota bacterium]